MSHAQPEFALEAYGLKKTYPGGKGAPAKEALKGVDLQIPRGSIFGLLGPNGAGKSTFINIFAGLVTKSAGTAKIWGAASGECVRTLEVHQDGVNSAARSFPALRARQHASSRASRW